MNTAPTPQQTATDRLHSHVRQRLNGWPRHIVTLALEAADAVHMDGAGSMQLALDTGIAAALEAALQETAP